MEGSIVIVFSGSMTSFLGFGFAADAGEALLHQTPIEALRSDSIVSATGR
jgi:hypothetical protein